MNKSYLITQCSVFKKLDGDSSSEFGLLAGDPNISYYESLFSPSVNVTIETTDVSGFVSREEIYGGQSIEISIKMSMRLNDNVKQNFNVSAHENVNEHANSKCQCERQ